jgi:hypothetical protein
METQRMDETQINAIEMTRKIRDVPKGTPNWNG